MSWPLEVADVVFHCRLDSPTMARPAPLIGLSYRSLAHATALGMRHGEIGGTTNKATASASTSSITDGMEVETKTEGSDSFVWLPASIDTELEFWRDAATNSTPDTFIFPSSRGTAINTNNFLSLGGTIVAEASGLKRKERMKYTLGMNPNGWKDPSQDGRVISYQVSGMPQDESGLVLIDQAHEWTYRRSKGAEIGDFIGPFETPNEALTALQAEINAEQKVCNCVDWYPYYFGDLMICNLCHQELSPEKLALTVAFWRQHKPSDFRQDDMYNTTELEARFRSWMMGQQKP